VSDRYIYIKNGIVDLKKVELLPFSPDVKYYTKNKLNIELSEKEIEMVRGLKTVDDVLKLFYSEKLDGNLKKLFYGATLDNKQHREQVWFSYAQMLGYSIAPERMTAFFLLSGLQKTAKSTLMNVMTLLFSDKDITSIEAQTLFGTKSDATRFSKVALLKRIVLCEEIQEKGLSPDELKRIITNEKTSVEFKGRNIGDDADIRARLFGTTNNVLNFSGQIEGLDRRLKYIVLERRIPEEEVDINLIKKIRSSETALKQLFLIAIAGMNSIYYYMNMKKPRIVG
jgi:phage/plasmid-associated DNA primase